jgi:1,4-alpha-glucan branching enzyme
MYDKGRKKGTTRFSANFDGAQKVVITGDFNNWQGQPMRKQKSGQFVANLELPPGTYEYRYLVDGEWHNDPDNNAFAMNVFGSTNSVAVIEE